MTEENTAPVGDAEEQVKEIFDNLTPDQMLQNEFDLAESARDFRKVAHAAIHTACNPLTGRSGLSHEEKVQALDTARQRLYLAIKALDKGIDILNTTEVAK